MLMMSVGKQPQQQLSSSTLFSLRGSLLTLAILTLLSFTFLSLKYSSPLSPSPYSVTLGGVEPSRNQQPQPESDDEEYTDIYHSPRVFKLNYAEMENKFKVYIYEVLVGKEKRMVAGGCCLRKEGGVAMEVQVEGRGQ